MYVRNYSTDDIVVYKAHLNKGYRPIIEDNILPLFCGGIMAEHDTTIYSYGDKRYECNIHLGRHLEELIQNIDNISWTKLMKEFISGLNKKRKVEINKGNKKFGEEKIKEFENKFDEIIEDNVSLDESEWCN